MNDLSFLEDTQKVQDHELTTLNEHVESLRSKRTDIDFLKEKLAGVVAEELKLSREVIPQFLLSKGLTSITTDKGYAVTVKENISVSLPKKDIIKRRAVLRFIVENKGESIIKDKLEVEEPEVSLLDYLKESSIPFDRTKSVHASTLKAWFKNKLGLSKGALQEIEVGDVPTEANLFVYNETKIK